MLRAYLDPCKYHRIPIYIYIYISTSFEGSCGVLMALLLRDSRAWRCRSPGIKRIRVKKPIGFHAAPSAAPIAA